jgi:hypothetical protein
MLFHIRDISTMNVIIDTLILGPEKLNIIKDKYPQCQITQLTYSDYMIQQYLVTIHDKSEDDYYMFLLDNVIAMSSNNFYSNVKSDMKFNSRIKARLSSED